MSILLLMRLKEYTENTNRLSIESIIQILRYDWLKNKNEEWEMFFLLGLKRITDQESDKPESITLKKLKKKKLEELNIFKEILFSSKKKVITTTFEDSLDLEELVKTIEAHIKSWNFFHAEISKIKIEIPRKRNGLRISKVCHCGKYEPRSTKGVIILDCKNCGGTKPQPRLKK